MSKNSSSDFASSKKPPAREDTEFSVASSRASTRAARPVPQARTHPTPRREEHQETEEETAKAEPTLHFAADLEDPYAFNEEEAAVAPPTTTTAPTTTAAAPTTTAGFAAAAAARHDPVPPPAAAAAAQQPGAHRVAGLGGVQDQDDQSYYTTRTRPLELEAELVEDRTVAPPPPPPPDNNLVIPLAEPAPEPSPGWHMTRRNTYILAAFMVLFIGIAVLLTIVVTANDDSPSPTAVEAAPTIPPVEAPTPTPMEGPTPPPTPAPMPPPTPAPTPPPVEGPTLLPTPLPRPPPSPVPTPRPTTPRPTPVPTPPPTPFPTPPTTLSPRAALEAFYFATGGDNWINCSRGGSNPCNPTSFSGFTGTPWLATNDPCDWGGVGCNSQGAVTEIRLFNNGLAGSLPSEVAALSALEILNLGGNQLTGRLPESLFDLSNLVYLYLYSNQLTGGIPESVGDLSNLERLYLYWNQLTGRIPESVGDLSNLVYLWLHNNQLTGPVPESLGSLDNLESLDLENNMLTGSIPAAVCNDPSVTWIEADADICAASVSGCCRS